MDDNKLLHTIESILYLSGQPVKVKDIAEKLEVDSKKILGMARELQKTYSGECGIILLIFNDTLQFSSNSIYAEEVTSVLNPIKEHALSKAMLETVAVIAYKQPITKLEIEQLRGVNCDYAVRILLENNLIEVVGRKNAVGKPLLFGTTDKFLRHFNIEKIDDLPDYDQLLEQIKIIEDKTKDIYDKGVVEVPVEKDSKENYAQITIGESIPEHLIGEDYVKIGDWVLI